MRNKYIISLEKPGLCHSAMLFKSCDKLPADLAVGSAHRVLNQTGSDKIVN